MKYLVGLPILIITFGLLALSHVSSSAGEKVIIDNDKIRVIEHTSPPQGDVCGHGMHHHEPHLTVVLSDARVQITPEVGAPQIVDLIPGTSIWFESESHAVINKGDKPTKMILVYLKQ